MGNGVNIFDLFGRPPKQQTVVNLDKDRSLRGKKRVQARKRERREKSSD